MKKAASGAARPSAKKAGTRTRLSPELRRGQILDAAAGLVLEQGATAITMEALGEAAGVSKGLVYAYFANCDDVLADLALREVKHFQHEGRAAVEAASDFGDLIRRTTRAYFDHVAKRGVLIQRLVNEPKVAAHLRAFDVREHSITVDYLSRQASRRYGIPLRRTRLICELLMGVTGRAGEMLYRGAASRADLEDLVFSIIFAALEKLETPSAHRARAPAARKRRSRSDVG